MSRPAPTFGDLTAAGDRPALSRMLEQAQRVEAPPAEGKYEPTPREIPIEIAWQDPATGDVRECRVNGRVPNHDGMQLRDRLTVRLTQGLSWDALPALTRQLAVARARCAVQLIEPPDWLLNALAEDDVLALELGGALTAHEDRYFRRDVPAGEAQARRVMVRPVGLAAPADSGR